MRRSKSDLLWDAWCVTSLIGIWPRFIEPRLLLTTKLRICIPNLPKDLQGLRIVQFSDLHFHAAFPRSFLRKLQARISALNPDIIVFSGDFLCHSKLTGAAELLSFLNSLKAPLGCYAVLGNHDYEKRIGVSPQGEYDVVEEEMGSLIYQGFHRLLFPPKLQAHVTEKARALRPHLDLVKLLSSSAFTVLHNACLQVAVGAASLNICGLGEYSCGQTLPKVAFRNYQHGAPGILLLHNPDGMPLLKEFPGDIVLSGHTHGGQVNLPGMWKKFTLLEHPHLKRGLVHFDGKWVYVNRGVGSVFPFRWFAPPELLLLTLV